MTPHENPVVPAYKILAFPPWGSGPQTLTLASSASDYHLHHLDFFPTPSSNFSTNK